MRLRLHPAIALLGLCIGVAGIASCDATALIGQPGAGGGGGSASMIVYGSTTSATTGAVVANLTVTAEDSSCSGTSYGSASGASSSTGTYRIEVTSSSTSAGCVVVTGTVSGNPNPVTLTKPNLDFTTGDSVVVNLSFP